jgi:hypothetical protein
MFSVILNLNVLYSVRHVLGVMSLRLLSRWRHNIQSNRAETGRQHSPDYPEHKPT